jgi:hypothetical protein
MKADNASSGTSTGTASETKPPEPQVPPEKLSESEYLAQQAEAAKRAMAQVWSQVKGHLAQGAAPQAWAREFPWITVGAAAVAGFVAASALIPSKEEQALKKLAAIERALNPAPPRTEHADGNGHGKKESGSMLSTILHEVLAVARPAIVSLMTAGLTGAMPPAAEDQAEPEGASGNSPNTKDAS